LVLLPATTVCEDGETEIVKSVTISVTVVLCCNEPLVPVMVNV
jgi:hypothetical protein